MGGFFASRRAVAVVALVCIALILVAVNVIVAERLPVRLDLTAEKLYTLSPGTRRTLARINEPIVLRFYYSTAIGDEAPSVGIYADRVHELLTQYAAAAPGKIRLETYNPQPFSGEEDRAVAFGLQGVPLGNGGEQGYFGLAGTNSTDDQQVIKFFAPQRERFLEYDLTKLVHALAAPKKPVVGLLSSLPLQGDVMAMMRRQPTHQMAVLDELQQVDTIETLSGNLDAIPADVDVLMLVHPQQLPEQTLYAIDQFVLKGGKALIFVDPYSEMQAARARRPSPSGSGSDLNRLFKAWGFEVPPGTVVGDRRSAQRVSIQLPDQGPQVADYIAWLDLRGGDLNRNDTITADLNEIRLATAGFIEPTKGGKTTIEPLLETSPDSTRIPAAKLTGVPDVMALLAGFKPDNKRYILAARVSGTVTTAFPGGPPKPPEAKPPAAAKPAAPQLKQSARPINVVVVADTDLLDDRFWVRTQDLFGERVTVPIANNGAFVANAVDVLAGGEDLIGLRSRGTSARPFLVLDRIQRQAQQHYSAEEQGLRQKLKNAQAKLQDLTGSGSAKPAAALSSAQIDTIAQFRADLLQTRRALRQVQAALRRNIERMEATIEFFDIALVPIIVAVVAVVLGAVRLQRRRRRAAEA